MKQYIPLYEAKDEDKYYDVTIKNPDTKREIQLMTALSYPEESEVYKKAIEIKKYLDSNEGKGIDVEDLNDKDKEKLKGLSKGEKDDEEVESNKELDATLKSILDSPIDSEKKKVISQQIQKAEDVRKKYIVYRMKLEKAIDTLNNEIKAEKGKDTTKKESSNNKCRFTGVMHEAVIYPYYIQNICNEIIDLKRYILRKPESIMFYLNTKLYNKYLIKFEIGSESLNYTSDAEYDIRTNTITIKLSPMSFSLNSYSFDNFIKTMKEVIGHELIHRIQYARKKYIKLVSEDNKEYTAKYLANKDEIMSFAFQTIEWFRNEGLLDNEISNKLKKARNKDTWVDFEKGKVYSMYFLDLYLNRFDKDSPVIKRYFKYMQEYLEV